MNREELDEILNKHSKWLRGETGGKRANLKDADLRGADLERANLKDADLRGADLERANLGGADLKDADLRRANLGGANIKGADLGGSNLVDADLKDADLWGSNLGLADLERANLKGADLVGANLERADLVGAKNGEEEIKKCNTVLGLNYRILMFQNIVTVGCQKHELSRWIDFSESEVKEMASDALEFYPLLIQILKHEYKNTPWAF